MRGGKRCAGEAEAHAGRRSPEACGSRGLLVTRSTLLRVPAEKLLRENREKLSEADIVYFEEALEKSALAPSGQFWWAMQSAAQELEAASHKVAEVLYRAAAAAGAGPAPGGHEGGPTPGGDGTGKKPPDGDVIAAQNADVDESTKPNKKRRCGLARFTEGGGDRKVSCILSHLNDASWHLCMATATKQDYYELLGVDCELSKVSAGLSSPCSANIILILIRRQLGGNQTGPGGLLMPSPTPLA